MNKHSSKQHIYTFVIGKKKLPIIIAAMLIFAVAFWGSKFLEKSEGRGVADFLKSSTSSELCGYVWGKHIPDLPHIHSTNLLSYGSSVFNSIFSTAKTPEKIQVDYETSPVSDTQSQPVQPTSSKIILSEKSIVSEGLKLVNATDYTVNAQLLANSDVTYDATGSEPKVLIMHTHGCETYSHTDGKGLGPDSSYRTTDNAKNMTHLGELLAAKLKEKGINAIHDKTLCDSPSYNDAYKNSLTLIESYKSKYPSISFVFDIHRDAIATDDGTPIKLTWTHNGEKCAQVMIVCGTDAMGLWHPNWQDNLTLGLKIQQKLETKYPGLMRPLNLREERFNMHETTGSLIFEIGTHGNTMKEAERSIVYLAEGIGEVVGKSN